MAVKRTIHAQDGIKYIVTTDRTQGADYIELAITEVDGKVCPPNRVCKYIRKVVTNEDNEKSRLLRRASY